MCIIYCGASAKSWEAQTCSLTLGTFGCFTKKHQNCPIYLPESDLSGLRPRHMLFWLMFRSSGSKSSNKLIIIKCYNDLLALLNNLTHQENSLKVVFSANSLVGYLWIKQEGVPTHSPGVDQSLRRQVFLTLVLLPVFIEEGSVSQIMLASAGLHWG